MSFSTEIKNEICSNTYSRLEDICLLSGFFRNNITFSKNGVFASSENPKVIRKVFELIKELFDISAYVNLNKDNSFKKSYYSIFIDSKVSSVLESLMVCLDGVMFPRIPDYFLDSEDLKRAYLRGVFLAKGSINDPKKSRYHMEFLALRKEEAYFLVDILSYFNISAKVILRDNGYMTYVKEAEKIGDFLRVVSANNAILYYEDIRIYRDHKNMTNRLNNCEQANVDKIIDASSKQFLDINLIKDKIGLEGVSSKLKDVIIYREKYPEASLFELSNIMSVETGKSISKSGLSHRFRKIHELAERIRSEKS